MVSVKLCNANCSQGRQKIAEVKDHLVNLSLVNTLILVGYDLNQTKVLLLRLLERHNCERNGYCKALKLSFKRIVSCDIACCLV